MALCSSYRLYCKRFLLPSLALRKRHFAFLALAGRAVFPCETDRSANTRSASAVNPVPSTDPDPATRSRSMTTKINMPPTEKLVLYYDHFSFYSQKVVMVLHEKNIPFNSHQVNLFKSQQYEPWFLERLNPLGEVPVLDDNGKIIPGSALIIDYLEDNFSNGSTPRLIPMNAGPEVRQTVNHFRHVIQQAPAGMLTTGAVLHPEILQDPKVPFFGLIRKALANAEKSSGNKLRELAEKVPKAKEELLKKAARREEQYKELLDEKKFMELLKQIDKILTEAEEELAKHKGDKSDWWLCSPEFSIADIELAILLDRISRLGLAHLFWTCGKRPLIEKYYERVKTRDSYKKTIPTTFFLIKTILISQAPIVIGVVAALALVLGGVFIAKRYIS